MKPKIKRQMDYQCLEMRWICCDGKFVGAADTPKVAYERWAQLKRVSMLLERSRPVVSWNPA